MAIQASARRYRGVAEYTTFKRSSGVASAAIRPINWHMVRLRGEADWCYPSKCLTGMAG